MCVRARTEMETSRWLRAHVVSPWWIVDGLRILVTALSCSDFQVRFVHLPATLSSGRSRKLSPAFSISLVRVSLTTGVTDPDVRRLRMSLSWILPSVCDVTVTTSIGALEVDAPQPVSTHTMHGPHRGECIYAQRGVQGVTGIARGLLAGTQGFASWLRNDVRPCLRNYCMPFATVTRK